MAKMFKVFRGNVFTVKLEMNKWLEQNSAVQIKKMCVVADTKDLHLTILVHCVPYGNIDMKQMIEIFHGNGKDIEQDMNSWKEFRPGVNIIKMRMVVRGVSDELISLIVYSQSEPEVC